MLAEDLVRMGLARLDGMKAVEPLDEEIGETVLVVGSGRAGLEAALAAAGLGHPVVLVEEADELGGLPGAPDLDRPRRAALRRARSRTRFRG